MHRGYNIHNKVEKIITNVSFIRIEKCRWYFYVLDKLILSSNYKQIPETKEIIEFLKKNRNFILSYKGFTKSRKIAIVALSFGSVWYKKLVEYRLKKLD